MCEFCDHDRAKAFFERLYQRQINRRRRDIERFRSPNPEDAGRRPHPRERDDALLCYATGSHGRYRGYSGAAGGMVAPKTGAKDEKWSIADNDQARRRVDRLHHGGLHARNKADEAGLLAGWRNRPYCNCAEACAASLAISYGEAIGDLIFVSFSDNTRPAPPCGNCTSWLNRLAGGYFTVRDSHTAAVGMRLEDAEPHLRKANLDSEARLKRTGSFNLIINPGRTFRDTPFQSEIEIKGKMEQVNFVFRCFR